MAFTQYGANMARAFTAVEFAVAAANCGAPIATCETARRTPETCRIKSEISDLILARELGAERGREPCFLPDGPWS
jgi:hypothetical protein